MRVLRRGALLSRSSEGFMTTDWSRPASERIFILGVGATAVQDGVRIRALACVALLARPGAKRAGQP
jgi:hypothetical protein